MEIIIKIWNSFVLVYFILVNICYLILLIISIFKTRYNMKKLMFIDYDRIFHSRITPTISILVPSYNEEKTIVENVRSLLLLKYPVFEIVVINDGSHDNTIEVLKQAFSLKKEDRICRKSIETKPLKGYYKSLSHSNLVVLDKENGGKADALNCGVNIAKYDYFCAIDSDVIIENDALLKAIRPIVEDPEHVVACGGIIRIANGCDIKNGQIVQVKLYKNPLVIFQIIEYLRGFLTGRTALSHLNSLLIISGAFGIFKKELVKIIGGYSTNTVGEDMELVVRLHRYLRSEKKKYRIVFISDPTCWTEVPESLNMLGRQRNRWHRGLIDSIIWHRIMLFNPKYGIVGLFGMPFFLFVEMLSPIIEIFGYISIFILLLFGKLEIQFFISFLLLTILYGIFLSMCTIILEELSFNKYTKFKDLVILMFVSIFESIGYRQLNLWWKLNAFVYYFEGRKDWGEMLRKGFAPISKKEDSFY